jgi:hypothetical protein
MSASSGDKISGRDRGSIGFFHFYIHFILQFLFIFPFLSHRAVERHGKDVADTKRLTNTHVHTSLGVRHVFTVPLYRSMREEGKNEEKLDWMWFMKKLIMAPILSTNPTVTLTPVPLTPENFAQFGTAVVSPGIGVAVEEWGDGTVLESGVLVRQDRGWVVWR